MFGHYPYEYQNKCNQDIVISDLDPLPFKETYVFTYEEKEGMRMCFNKLAIDSIPDLADIDLLQEEDQKGQEETSQVEEEEPRTPCEIGDQVNDDTTMRTGTLSASGAPASGMKRKRPVSPLCVTPICGVRCEDLNTGHLTEEDDPLLEWAQIGSEEGINHLKRCDSLDLFPTLLTGSANIETVEKTKNDEMGMELLDPTLAQPNPELGANANSKVDADAITPKTGHSSSPAPIIPKTTYIFPEPLVNRNKSSSPIHVAEFQYSQGMYRSISSNGSGSNCSGSTRPTQAQMPSHSIISYTAIRAARRKKRRKSLKKQQPSPPKVTKKLEMA